MPEETLHPLDEVSTLLNIGPEGLDDEAKTIVYDALMEEIDYLEQGKESPGVKAFHDEVRSR